MATLLQKWLIHYDPIHRGWTPAGIANGVCCSCGYFFPRTSGGYNLWRKIGDNPVASDPIVGAAGHDAQRIHTFPWIEHAAETTYTYALSAIGGGGIENMNNRSITEAAFDEHGLWRGTMPNAPADLAVESRTGGRFRIAWSYSRQGQQAQADRFRLYHNSGSGAVDYDTIVAEIPCKRSGLYYEYLSAAFEHGHTVTWCVRAVSTDNVEEGNRTTITGTAHGQAPAIRPVSTAETIEVP